VAIVGVGGVGGLVGALLSRRGDAVKFVATESTASVLTEQGVQVRSGRYGSFTVTADAVTMLNSPVDVCVVAVKAMQLEAAMGRVPVDRIGKALVVPFLNGVEHIDALRAQYGSRVVPATMRVASTRTAPGVIEHSSPFMKVELALLDDGDVLRGGRVANFASHLQAAGVDVAIRRSEQSMLWEKLIFLAPFALLTTKYGTSAGNIRTAHRDELLVLIEEIARIAKKMGAVLSEDTAVQFFDSVPATMQSSMQHDAAAGRAIEVEAIGGAVLRAAGLIGISAPAVERLVEQLRQVAPSNQPRRRAIRVRRWASSGPTQNMALLCSGLSKERLND
jgi:2-dehydropantoate 2-reductase